MLRNTRQYVSVFSFYFLLCTLLVGCRHTPDNQPEGGTVDYAKVETPAFCADSAYLYVEEQMAFGNRIPGSDGWQACATYLNNRLSSWCDTVIVQDFNATLWDGSRVPGRNIIGSINPEANKRVLLAAHWDSRMWADHDDDPDNWKAPVPGANDGASGVAMLLELARIMSAMPPSVGLDFVLFDVEDQGVPEWSETYDENSWCKGSQHWARNKHTAYYTAVYGILFDMVGTTSPRFTKEQVSRSYAPGLTDKLWSAAAALGYGDIFVDEPTDPIMDDHYYVNAIAAIPMVDIVQNNANDNFFEHWHTTTDNLQAVSKQTLGTVGTVVLKTIYCDYPAKR